ncbi:DUF4347 domain-containing protein [uncultured Pseudoteredinibacter sp.]|uniref:DUF4347 domain-containing protein n=1 Tax=uncultured Pseudoteredinibacter sp. TaxID=1641701 RepID=UPI0026249FEB|nr:DUF4347 domain-containing protein [uncultured Pseudoteredinibacter sp.]
MKITKSCTHKKAIIEPLGKRLLYSADTAFSDLLMSPSEDRDHQLVTEEMLDLITADDSKKELVLINSDVADIEIIIDQLESSPRNLEYLVIDVAQQGSSFVGQYIASMNNIDAIHLIGHGEPGSFQLGSDTISQEFITSSAEEISNWQASLSENAAIHLYGCDIASENSYFVDSLAGIIGRPVFASEDTTGFSELGGDWVLEYGKDQPAYKNLFDENFAQVYASVLAPNTSPTFDVPDGQLLVNTSGGIDIINDGLVQADGKIVVMGHANDGNWDYLLSRYNSDGTLDETFGTDGAVRLDLGSGREQGFALAQQADGKLVLVGSKDGLDSSGSDVSDDFVVARLNTDGSLDNGFGNSGYIQVNFADEGDYPRDVIIQSDGSIVVVGEVGRDVGVLKLNSNGQLDTGFGTNGKLTIDVSGNTDLAKAVTQLDDGSLVIVGHSIDTSYDFLMINLSQDGSAGPNFHIVRQDLGSNSIDAFYAVTQQNDGKIVVAGASTLNGHYNSTLVRTNLDGSFDSSFGNNGVANEPVLLSSDYAKDVEILPDGSYITAGWIGNDFSVVKYNSAGALDTSFANGGVYKSPIGGYSVAEAVEVLPDGSIIAIGHFSENSESKTLVFKLDANGVLDQSFAPSSTINDKPTYVEGAVPIVLDSSIDIVDTELDSLNSGQGNYAGASLTVERVGGANAEDLLAIAGASLIKSGQVIATVDNSIAGRISISFTDANGETPTSQDVDAIFSQITYANNSDAPPANIQLSWTFSDGNSGAQGSGGAATVVEQSTVNITAVDDRPVNSGTPLDDVTAFLNQDLALDLSGLEVSDADYAGELVRVVLSSTNGEFSGLAGTGVSVQTFANGFIVNGNINDVNAYLNTVGNVTYNSDTAGNDQINVSFIVGTVTVSDVDSFNVDVLENTAPVVIAPTTISVDEDSASNSVTGLSITDDASNGNIEVELTTTGGSLNLDLNGLTVVAGSNDSTTITVMGSLPDVNTSLQTLNYSPANNVFGASVDSIAISVNDLGSSGGPALTTTGQIVVDINAQNDAPTGSGNYSDTLLVTEGQSTNIDFTGFTVDDLEGGDLTLTLRPISGGQLSFNNTANVSINHNTATNVYSIIADKDTLNSFLSLVDSIQYSHPDLNLSGSNVDRISIQITDQDISAGNSGITVVLQAIDVSIQAVNNAPTISLSDNYTLDEDSTLNITDIQIADSDAGNADVSVTIEAHYGSLSLSQVTGVSSNGSLVTLQDGSTIYRLIVVGSVDAINNVIGSLQYTPDQDFYGNGADSIKVKVDDQGNTGGPAGTASKVATLNIIPTPDPATNTGAVPSTLVVTEDQLSTLDLSSLEFADPDWDVATSQYTLTLSTSAGGNLNVNSALPVNIQNSGSNSVTVSGSLAELNQLLNETTAITYLHGVENTNGLAADSLSISLEQVSSDNLAAQQIANIDINIAAQNDAPSITVPSQISATADQNQPLVGISIADVDAGSETVSIRVAVETGSLFLAQTTGLTVVSVVFTNANGETVNGTELGGSIADINQALNSLSYTAASNVVGAGADSLSIVINDGGNTGGAALEASRVIDIDVSPQASNPSNSGTLPANLMVVEDTLSPLGLSSVVLADPDGSASNYQLTLSTNNGQLQVSGATGLTVNLISPGTVQLSGSISDLNTWLSNSSGLLYQHNTEHSFGDAADSLSLSISEGPGFSTSFDLGSSAINISAINDLATLSTPSSINLPEDGSQAVTGIVINDVDSDSFHIELSVQQGSLNIVGLDVGLLSGGSNGSDFIRLSGNQSDLQQALNNLNYSGPENLNGNQADQITVKLSEENGGTIDNVLSQNIDVNISTDNDAPVITAPTSVSVTSGDSIVLNGISISDADAGSAQVNVSVGIAQGTLQLGQSTGVTANPVSFTDGSGNTVTGIELTGSIDDINNALASLSLATPSGLSTAVTETLTIIANDLGNSGGVAQEAAATVSVTINAAAIGADPNNVGSLPNRFTVVEDVLSPLDLSAVEIQDADNSASTYQLTIQTSNGDLNVSDATNLTVVFTNVGTVQLSGALVDINNWLNNSSGLSYMHSIENSYGSAADSISLFIAEGPNFTTEISLGSVVVDITAVNDVATITADTSISLFESSSRDIALSLADVDGENFNVQISSQQGEIYIKNLNSTLITGGENNSKQISLSGNLADIQAALSNLSYISPSISANTLQDQVTISVTEINSGFSVNTINESINVLILSSNDAPQISGPSTIEINTESQHITGITVSDTDAGLSNLELSISISSGSLNISPQGQASIQPASTEKAIVLQGTITDLNATLQSLIYENSFEHLEGDSLEISINDLGSTGGQAKSDSLIINLDLNPTNVAPLSENSLIVIDEDQRYTLSLNQFTYIDKYNDSLSVIEIDSEAISGQLFLNGEKILAKQTIDPQEIIDGNLIYQPAKDQNGIALDNVKFRVADSSNEWSETYTIQIDVEAVNDQPSNTGASLADREEQALSWFDVSLEKITAYDIDAYDTELQLRIALVGSGELEAETGLNLTLIEESPQTIVLSGTLEAINTFLDDQTSLKARSTDNIEQNIQIVVEINDMGNTGKGQSDWVSLAETNISIEPFLAPVVELTPNFNEDLSQEIPVEHKNAIPPLDQIEKPDSENAQEEKVDPQEHVSTDLDPELKLVATGFDIDGVEAVIATPSSFDDQEFDRDNQQEQYDQLTSRLALSKAMAQDVADYNKAAYQFKSDGDLDRNSTNTENTQEVPSAAKIGQVFGAGAGLGLLWWLSRAGSLLAAMISIRPLWNEIDPLPILSKNKSASKERAEVLKDEESKDEESKDD